MFIPLSVRKYWKYSSKIRQFVHFRQNFVSYQIKEYFETLLTTMFSALIARATIISYDNLYTLHFITEWPKEERNRFVYHFLPWKLGTGISKTIRTFLRVTKLKFTVQASALPITHFFAYYYILEYRLIGLNAILNTTVLLSIKIHIFINIIPAAQDTPRYSIRVPMANSSSAPFPATRLSPMAPTTSMSPGRSLWTFVGRVILLPNPGDVMFLHGNGIDPGNVGCLLMPVGVGFMTISSLTAGVCEIKQKH